MPRFLWIFLPLISCSMVSAQVDSRPREGLRANTPRVHVLRGATVVPAPGRVIEDGTVVLRDGLVEAVGGAGVAVPEDGRVWDVSGKTIYAGFIEPWLETKVADAGGGAARHWNPEVRPERFAAQSLGELADDKVDDLRALGFTVAQLVPEAGVIRGSTCLVALSDGGSGERIMSKRVAQAAAFEHGRGDGYPSSLMGSIALVRQTLYDAQWQRDSLAEYLEDPKGVERVAANEALDALRPVVDGKQRVLFEARDELSFSRFSRVAGEFELRHAFLGCGFEYRVADQISVPVVLPLNFPAPPPVEDADAALEVSLAELQHWELAPSNAAVLEGGGVKFSLSSAKLADAEEEFWKNLRRCVGRGLSTDAALAALTVEPARLVGGAGKLGTIAPGKIANLVVADGDLFDHAAESKVHAVWVDGIRFEQEAGGEIDLAGKWLLSVDGAGAALDIEISGSGKSLKMKLGEESFPAKLTGSRRLLAFPDARAIGRDLDGIARLTASVVEPAHLSGVLVYPGGESRQFEADRVGDLDEKDGGEEEEEDEAEEVIADFDRYPAGAFGVTGLPPQVDALVVRDATVWTSGAAGRLEDADLLVERGKITAVGVDLEVPAGAEVVQGVGKHVTPGLIDCHSHIAISRGANEGTHAVTVEVRIGDVVDPTDIGIYRQLAGGLTTSNLLHGSANPMGGQNQVIKLRWGSDAEGLKFEGAQPGVKFALGENVKQSNWGDDETTRYPQTRMGVQQIMRDTFLAARDYRRELAAAGRRDLRMDAVLEILGGERLVHIHSYRQDEILMFVRLAEELGITVGTFQHVLEGYKVADAIAKIGAGGSTFSDWWAYKMEVVDAIPFNGALMREVGVVMSFNSDDAELATRMNLEAAKAVKYGGVTEEEALKFVTLNPAQQLRIDHRVGSLEAGKDADFVIWDGHPMTGRARALATWIDGRRYYSVDQNLAHLERIDAQRERLIAKALPERLKLSGKEEPEDEENGEEEAKPGLRFLLPSGSAGCRSIYRGLYHDGRSRHSCSRNGCCNN